MSPHGFVNSGYGNVINHHQISSHGFSLPPHNMIHPIQPGNSTGISAVQGGNYMGPQQPQVTMNINMNMYPNVMNINMGSFNGQNPVIPEYSHGLHHVPTVNSNLKAYGNQGFFT
jgi:hypothetical protein